jgi:acetyl esterase/lipase
MALAYLLSGLSLAVTLVHLSNPKFPLGIYLLWPKLFALALAPWWALVGALGAVLGWLSGAAWAVPMGLAGAVVLGLYVWRCTREHGGFDEAFGVGWAKRIEPVRERRMLRRRWSPYVAMKEPPGSAVDRDLPFWTVPGTERELLCDLWRPAPGDSSGLAYIYLHPSGWAAGDKGMFTHHVFRHLSAQGHTVMDVAYRLLPEVEISGMVGDAWRAVAWVKANAQRFDVDPEKVVLGGGSAGAHIATLAAYATEDSEWMPAELAEADLSVCGVLSFYPPTDLAAGARRYNRKRQAPVPMGERVDPQESFRHMGRLDLLLGGYPEEVPERYRLANPTSHLRVTSPPTLIFQGDRDFLNPIEGTREFRARALQVGAPAAVVIYPWTEHIFDLVLPRLNPVAQSALYDADRFLALLASGPCLRTGSRRGPTVAGLPSPSLPQGAHGRP